MGSMQKAFVATAKKLPRKILDKIIAEKLGSAGFAENEELISAIADHLTSGSTTPFEWAHDLPDIELRFDEADWARLEADVKAISEKTPEVIANVSRDMARKMLARYTAQWREYQPYDQGIVEVFRCNLEDRWGPALDSLRLMSDFSVDIGKRYFTKLQRSKSAKNWHLRYALSQLHVRCCQVTKEILVLLENGYADGAMARWRTLHELVIVSSVIHDGGNDVAKRYLDHEAVEAKKALEEYNRNHQALNLSPISIRETKAVTANYEDVVQRYGKDFKNEYGWASVMLSKPSPRFADLEAAANLSAMRSYYKMASYNVHAGIKGLTHRLGNIGEYGGVTAAASNAGLEEPGVRTANSVAALVVLMMGNIRNLDAIVEMHVLADLRDQTCRAFNRVARGLQKDIREKRRGMPTKPEKRRPSKGTM